MAQVIVRLQGSTREALGAELRGYEIGLALKDIGTDGTDNYGIYDERLIRPRGDIVLLPSPSVPPNGGDTIEQGPLVLGGVKQVFVAYRVPEDEGDDEE